MTPHRTPCLAAALLVLGMLTLASAQPYASDLLVAHSSGVLLRLTPTGKISTIGSYGPGFMWAITWDTDNRHLLAAFTTTVPVPQGHVLRIDPVSGAATTVIPAAASPIMVKLDQNGDYLLSNAPSATSQSVMRVKRNTTALVTIRTGFPFRPAFHRELSTGEWLVSSAMNQLERYAPDWSGIKAAIPHAFGYTYDMVQDPHRPDVYVGASACYRFDPRSNTMTSLFPGVGTSVGSRGLLVDRSPDVQGAMLYVTDSMVVPPDSHIYHYDRGGQRLATLTTVPNWLTDMVFDRSRNLATILKAPPNDRLIRLSFPYDGGCPYILAFSLTGYTPGVGLPDGRVIPLRFDSLVGLTAGGPLPPFLTGNHGVLAANGEAVARLDLNGFGPVLRGVKLWAAAMTLDPRAMLGIRTISKPVLLVLE